MRSFLYWIPVLALAASCSAPPKPPAIDETLRRPANRPSLVELQSCKHELHNARLSVGESDRMSTYRDGVQERFAAIQAIAETERRRAEPSGANRIYRVRFAFGSALVAVPPEVGSALLSDARGAPFILLKGRTDGTTDNAIDARLARERALAVRDHLVAAGVDPVRIRVTHQATGDGVADNTTAQGRAANRRVDIEVYSLAPIEPNFNAT